MDVRLANAAAAYAAGQLKGDAAAKAATASAAEEGQASFPDLVRSAVSGAVDASRNSEAVSMQALVNPGDLGQVVTAVSNAEITMQTVIAVRDRVVQAYQDILRMPI